MNVMNTRGHPPPPNAVPFRDGGADNDVSIYKTLI